MDGSDLVQARDSDLTADTALTLATYSFGRMRADDSLPMILLE